MQDYLQKSCQAEIHCLMFDDSLSAITFYFIAHNIAPVHYLNTKSNQINIGSEEKTIYFDTSGSPQKLNMWCPTQGIFHFVS